MRPGDTKIGTRIWTPLLAKFTARIASACLRRDAWLTKVLANELDELDSEITTPNSEAARLFIASRLDALPRKLVTLTLPDELVHRLDDICERKRIVRDSFFNRLFLLAAGPRHHDRLFFEGDDGWFQRVLEHTDLSFSAAGSMLDPIPEFRDPFRAIRDGLDVIRNELIVEFGNAEEADAYLKHRRIYTVPITEKTFPRIDLSGLNVYLPDWQVPGATRHYGAPVDLSDLLDDPPEPSEDVTASKEAAP